MEYIIKVNDMYLSFISVDNYDNNLSLNFTTDIESARKFRTKTFLKVIINNLSMLGFCEDEVQIINIGENDD